jgi:hypothetical protein
VGSQTNESCSDGNVVDGLIHAEHLGLQKVMNPSTAGGTIDISELVTTLLVWRSGRQRGLASTRAPDSCAIERANLTARMLAQPAERFPERFANAALRRLLRAARLSGQQRKRC